MKEIDKNDVNISKLWNWGTQFETETPQGMLTFWMRVVGDADLNRARVYGLRQSATLRRQLKDENSDERLALVPELDITEKDKIVTAILVYTVTELTDRAQSKLEHKTLGGLRGLTKSRARGQYLPGWPLLRLSGHLRCE